MITRRQTILLACLLLVAAVTSGRMVRVYLAERELSRRTCCGWDYPSGDIPETIPEYVATYLRIHRHDETGGLAACPERYIRDDDLAYLAQLPELRALNLSWCDRITDAGFAHLAGITQLRKLEVSSSNRFTDKALAHLAGLTQLEELNLWGCDKITDAGLAHLREMTQLQKLNLHGCGRITNDGLAHLWGMTELRTLSLPHAITDEGIEKLQKALPKCKIEQLWTI